MRRLELILVAREFYNVIPHSWRSPIPGLAYPISPRVPTLAECRASLANSTSDRAGNSSLPRECNCCGGFDLQNGRSFSDETDCLQFDPCRKQTTHRTREASRARSTAIRTWRGPQGYDGNCTQRGREPGQVPRRQKPQVFVGPKESRCMPEPRLQTFQGVPAGGNGGRAQHLSGDILGGVMGVARRPAAHQ